MPTPVGARQPGLPTGSLARSSWQDRRIEARRRRAMRTALRSGGLLVALISVLSAASFLLWEGGLGFTLFLLDLGQAAIALIVAAAIRGPMRRFPDALALLFLIWLPIVPLATIAVQPDLLLLVGSSLALIPSAVALVIPWNRRFFSLWAATYGAIVLVAATVVVPASAFPGTRIVELAAVVAIGIAFGVLGQRIRRRQDILAAEREALQRALSQQSMKQTAALANLNEELARTARTDALTGAGNRLRLDEDMAALADRLLRYGQTLSLILFDIDYFKQYNDRYGHVAGDDALRRVVRSLRDGLRPGDLIYRYGGEELLVVLPEQGAEGALAAAERLRVSLVDAAIPHAGNPPWKVLTVSAGVVAIPPGTASNWDRWVERADRALYVAKGAGRNRSQLATDEAVAKV